MDEDGAREVSRLTTKARRARGRRRLAAFLYACQAGSWIPNPLRRVWVVWQQNEMLRRLNAEAFERFGRLR
jgi:hypothetical protein